MSKYDVIVVGGGPAGAVAARECARLGLETVLLEKEFLPRPKTCAWAISAAAMNLLDVPIPRRSSRRGVPFFTVFMVTGK